MGSSADGTPVDLRAFTVVSPLEARQIDLADQIDKAMWAMLRNAAPPFEGDDSCPPPLVVEENR